MQKGEEQKEGRNDSEEQEQSNKIASMLKAKGDLYISYLGINSDYNH